MTVQLDLANEPQYYQSGRGMFSRAAWIAYLVNRHKSLAALNALYGL